MSISLTKYVLQDFKDVHSLKTGTTQSFSNEQKTRLMSAIFEVFIHHWLISRNSVFKQNYWQHFKPLDAAAGLVITFIWVSASK
jgi:hypothetical protein